MAEKGTITFSTALDNRQLEKDYQAAVKEVERLEKELGKTSEQKTSLEDSMDKATEAAERARQKLQELAAEQKRLQEIVSGEVRVGATPAEQSEAMAASMGRLKEITAEMKEQTAEMKKQAAASDRFLPKIDAVEKKEQQLTEALASQKQKAVEVEQALQQAMENQTTSTIQQRFTGLFKGIQNTAAKTAKRIKTMFLKVFLFSIILSGLRQLKDLIGNAITNNDQASAALARLKAAFLTMVQPVIDAVIPALTWLMDIMTQALVIIGRFTAMIFGKSYEQSKKNAQALQGQAEGVEAVGKAAKDANGYLAGFDELNTMNDTSSDSTGAAWDFEESSDAFREYEEDTAQIAAGVEQTFDGVKQFIDGVINGDIDQAFDGLHEIVDGTGTALHGLVDLIFDFLEQVTGGKIAAFLEPIRTFLHTFIDGLTEMAHGFLDVVKGILTGDIDLIMQGLNRILSGALTIVGGFIDLIAKLLTMAVEGFFDWLDKITGGRFHGVLMAIKNILIYNIETIRSIAHELIDDIKGIFHGLTEFIAGVFTGDFDRALGGLKEVFKSAVNAYLAVIEGFLGMVVNGVNQLTGLLGEIKINVPDWVPKFGGAKWSFEIPKIQAPKLPRLASGAVIPPNREFAAVLGDQSSGMNIEAPEDLIRQIVREESGNAELITLLGSILQAVRDGHNLYVDKRILGRVASEQIGNMTRMGGAY